MLLISLSMVMAMAVITQMIREPVIYVLAEFVR